MYREQHPDFEMNLIFDNGGIGDKIARLPAIEYMIKAHPQLTLNVWANDYIIPIMERSLTLNDRLRIYDIEKDSELYDNSLITRAIAHHKVQNLAYHMTEHAFMVICERQGYPQVYNYPKINVDDIKLPHIPYKYAVITTGFTSYTREMKPRIINEIIDFVLSKGILPVFLGRKNTCSKLTADFNDEINFSKGMNLIDATDILQSAKIIQNAEFIIGLDNGLLHLAAMTDVPIIGGYTTVNPLHRLPYRHNVLGWKYYSVFIKHSELPCTMCQSNWTITYGHDFRKCYYGDYKCLDMLNAEKYIEQIENVLKDNNNN